MKDRVIVITVGPTGNTTIDGSHVYERDVKSHLENLKKIGFHKFHVIPYCSLVSSYKINKVQDIVNTLK